MILEIEDDIVKKNIEIEALRSQVAYWEDYRDRGQQEHLKTVQLLEHEIADMEASFAEISGIVFLISILASK